MSFKTKCTSNLRRDSDRSAYCHSVSDSRLLLCTDAQSSSQGVFPKSATLLLHTMFSTISPAGTHQCMAKTIKRAPKCVHPLCFSVPYVLHWYGNPQVAFRNVLKFIFISSYQLSMEATSFSCDLQMVKQFTYHILTSRDLLFGIQFPQLPCDLSSLMRVNENYNFVSLPFYKCHFLWTL
jgi:hypothetical protein